MYRPDVWPWKHKAAPPEDPDVYERLALLERDMKNLRLEWEDAYEKFVHLMRRLNKRDARAADEPAPAHAEPASGNGVEAGQLWTNEQRKAQQDILARRSRGGMRVPTG